MSVIVLTERETRLKNKVPDREVFTHTHGCTHAPYKNEKKDQMISFITSSESVDDGTIFVSNDIFSKLVIWVDD